MRCGGDDDAGVEAVGDAGVLRLVGRGGGEEVGG